MYCNVLQCIVVETIINHPMCDGLYRYMFIPPIYGDLGDGLLLF